MLSSLKMQKSRFIILKRLLYCCCSLLLNRNRSCVKNSFIVRFGYENYDFAVVILFIIIHSLIDFDLSFGIVLIIFGLVVGSSITFEFKKQKRNYQKKPKTLNQ